ncbi:MAG: ATP-binding protein, partial [Verrucomicrobiota bacterium]
TKLHGASKQLEFDDFHRNRVELISLHDGVEELIIESEGKVEMADTHGIVGPHAGYQTSKDFLDLFFDENKREKSLMDLNPLNEVEISFPKPDGSFDHRVLEFLFNRILDHDGKVRSLFVEVSDITEQATLAGELRQAEKKKERQLQLIMGAMNVERNALVEFIQLARRQLEVINRILKEDDTFLVQADQPGSQLQEKLRMLENCVHNIKGNASMLGLDYFADEAHLWEEQIRGLLIKPSLAGDDVLPLLLTQAEYRDDLAELSELLDKFLGLSTQQSAPFSQGELSEHLLYEQLRNYVERAKREQDQDVTIDLSNLDSSVLRAEVREELPNLLVQLIRNSFAHSLEPRTERLAVGKSEKGMIVISSHQNPSPPSYSIIYEDDGRGLDLNAIRQRAETSGILSEGMANTATSGELNQLIFHPHFSTKEEAGQDAGRGVGLAYLRQYVVETLQGEVSVHSTPGQFIQFHLSFPEHVLGQAAAAGAEVPSQS